MSEPEKSAESMSEEFERYRIRYGFYKTLIGSALVGVLGIVVPGAIEFWSVHFETKQKNLETEIRYVEKQQEYVKDFLDTALTQDIELRLRFAQYFSKVSPGNFKENWNELYTILKNSRDETRKEINEKEAKIRHLLNVSELTVEQRIEIEQLDRELEWRYKEVGYVPQNRSVVPSKQEQKSATTPSSNSQKTSNRKGYLPGFLGSPDILFPRTASPETGLTKRLNYAHHSVLYSLDRRAPLAVAAMYDGGQRKSVRRGLSWSLDARIGVENQVDPVFFINNPWDRGHLISRLFLAWGATEEEALLASNDANFYTQVELMHQNVNRDEWFAVEKHVREIVAESRAVIFAGPVFQGSAHTIDLPSGATRLAPSAFWMIAYVQEEDDKRAEYGFIVPQNDKTLFDDKSLLSIDIMDHSTSIENIENATGLIFGR